MKSNQRSNWIGFIASALTFIVMGFSAVTDAREATMGPGSGGGGDQVAAEFMDLGFKVAKIVAFRKDLFPLNEVYLWDVVASSKVETAESLKLNGVPKDAINYPDKRLIKVSRSGWREMSPETKYQIVMHEYLGVLGVKDDMYQVSSKIHIALDENKAVLPIVFKALRQMNDLYNLFSLLNLRIETGVAQERRAVVVSLGACGEYDPYAVGDACSMTVRFSDEFGIETDVLFEEEYGISYQPGDRLTVYVAGTKVEEKPVVVIIDKMKRQCQAAALNACSSARNEENRWTCIDKVKSACMNAHYR